MQVASATRTTVARLRLGMVAANLAATAWRAGQAVRSRAVEVGPELAAAFCVPDAFMLHISCVL
jgi:hypothetical protein